MAKKKPGRRSADVRKYLVHANLENVQLAKATSALTLLIYSRGTKTGELQVGRGSLFWWGAHRKKAQRIRWGRFAEVMNYLAYGDD